eukprot:TRINITY_DN68503_c0_g1_i1.p1 TRINITY_DN68503_c0_g1~~TRINITY_DN68503_c0_g1_i1.p1  ORF type:complete len:523 (+),score=77.88 TRINITY_DN68503_c0_g1_i1:205-1773(+)
MSSQTALIAATSSSAEARAATSHSSSSLVNRKRRLEHTSGEQQSDRPSKRKRIGHASVLCMRELFRGVIKDGTITQTERINLQNAAVLLSQVKGDTWVNFPETNGNLQELTGTRQQLASLRDFLSVVAEELKARETQCEVETEDSLAFLQLAEVPWADGITVRELLSCCNPEAELEYKGRFGWIEKATKPLPPQYMVRARVRELINFYYLKYWTPEGDGAEPDDANMGSGVAGKRRRQSRGSDAARAVATPGFCERGRVALLRGGLIVVKGCALRCQSAISHVGQAVLFIVTSILAVLFQILRLLPWSDEPLWPTLTFVLTALLYRPTRGLLEFVVMLARLRVALCFIGSNKLSETLFFPVVFVAKKFLHWREESWLFGCACEGNDESFSLLSFVPVKVCHVFVMFLKLLLVQLRPVPVLGSISESLASLVDTLEPLLLFVFDLTFSLGVSEGMAGLLRKANSNAESKLTLMSMKVARLLRGELVPEAAPAPLQRAASSQRGNEDALPSWNDDGTWNLFGDE